MADALAAVEHVEHLDRVVGLRPSGTVCQTPEMLLGVTALDGVERDPPPRLPASVSSRPCSRRREALDLAELTDQAFRDWDQMQGSLQADTFLTGFSPTDTCRDEPQGNKKRW